MAAGLACPLVPLLVVVEPALHRQGLEKPPQLKEVLLSEQAVAPQELELELQQRRLVGWARSLCIGLLVYRLVCHQQQLQEPQRLVRLSKPMDLFLHW